MSRKSQTGGNTEPLPFVRKWGMSTNENIDNSIKTFPPVFEAADNLHHSFNTHETSFNGIFYIQNFFFFAIKVF